MMEYSDIIQYFQDKVEDRLYSENGVAKYEYKSIAVPAKYEYKSEKAKAKYGSKLRVQRTERIGLRQANRTERYKAAVEGYTGRVGARQANRTERYKAAEEGYTGRTDIRQSNRTERLKVKKGTGVEKAALVNERKLAKIGAGKEVKLAKLKTAIDKRSLKYGDRADARDTRVQRHVLRNENRADRREKVLQDAEGNRTLIQNMFKEGTNRMNVRRDNIKDWRHERSARQVNKLNYKRDKARMKYDHKGQKLGILTNILAK